MPGLYAKEDDFPVTRELGYASWLNRVTGYCENGAPLLTTPPRSSIFLSMANGAPPCEISEEIQFRQRLRGSDVGRHVPHAAKSYPMSPLVSDVPVGAKK